MINVNVTSNTPSSFANIAKAMLTFVSAVEEEQNKIAEEQSALHNKLAEEKYLCYYI